MSRQHNIDTAFLFRVSKVKIDESKIVLTSIPNSSKSYGRDRILSIVDNNLIVVYNTNTGGVVDYVSIDTLMKGAGFNVLQYIEKNCKGTYLNRRYIASQYEVEEVGDLPAYKLLAIPAIETDSIYVLVGILTPYFQATEIDGKVVAGQFLERSTALVSINLSKKKLNSIKHVKSDLLHVDKASDQVIFPLFRIESLFKNGVLFTTVSTDPLSKIQTGEQAVFSLNTEPQTVKISTIQYPQEYFTTYSRSIVHQSIENNNDGTLYYNDLFNIYDITNFAKPRLVLSLKDKLDQHQRERINTFHKIDDNMFLIQTIAEDSIRNCRFKFYDLSTTKLSTARLTYPSIAPIEYVVYNEEGFIKFTKDAENTYFEKYEVADISTTEPNLNFYHTYGKWPENQK